MLMTFAPRSMARFIPKSMSGIAPSPTGSALPVNCAAPSTRMGRTPQSPASPGGRFLAARANDRGARGAVADFILGIGVRLAAVAEELHAVREIARAELDGIEPGSHSAKQLRVFHRDAGIHDRRDHRRIARLVGHRFRRADLVARNPRVFQIRRRVDRRLVEGQRAQVIRRRVFHAVELIERIDEIGDAAGVVGIDAEGARETERHVRDR